MSNLANSPHWANAFLLLLDPIPSGRLTKSHPSGGLSRNQHELHQYLRVNIVLNCYKQL